jgi:hypothetical protein
MEYSENLKKADISISSSGDNTIISAPASGYIVIDHINFIPTTAVNVQFKDGTTAYGGAYPLDAKQAFVLENAMGSEKGVITLTPKTAFVMNLSGATQTSGFCRYRIIGE